MSTCNPHNTGNDLFDSVLSLPSMNYSSGYLNGLCGSIDDGFGAGIQMGSLRGKVLVKEFGFYIGFTLILSNLLNSNCELLLLFAEYSEIKMKKIKNILNYFELLNVQWMGNPNHFGPIPIATSLSISMDDKPKAKEHKEDNSLESPSPSSNRQFNENENEIENENITCVRTYDDLIASGRSKFRQLLSLLGKDWKGVFKENTQNDEGGGNSDGSSTNPKLTLTQKQNDSKLKITKEDSIQTIAAKIQNSF